MIVLREIVMVCCIYSITQNVYNMCKLCHINGGLFYAFYILWKIFVTCIYSMYMFVSKTSQTNFYVLSVKGLMIVTSTLTALTLMAHTHVHVPVIQDIVQWKKLL